MVTEEARADAWRKAARDGCDLSKAELRAAIDDIADGKPTDSKVPTDLVDKLLTLLTPLPPAPPPTVEEKMDRIYFPGRLLAAQNEIVWSLLNQKESPAWAVALVEEFRSIVQLARL